MPLKHKQNGVYSDIIAAYGKTNGVYNKLLGASVKSNGVYMADMGISLFSNGEQGAWYDPSDFSTMFQDSAGTTPVTAAEQPVGLIRDKSGRGNHASQVTSTKRPVLKLSGGKYSLLFDGVDDALVTSAINFTATDKMMVVAGVRKLSDAATAVIAELSVDGTSWSGAFALFAPSGSGATKFSWRSRGTAQSSAETTSIAYNAPFTAVTSNTANISGDSAVLRINGGQVATSAADQGTGNYGNYPLYIGSRAGTALPFNGHLYSLIIRGAQSTDAQIAAAETYANSRTGAY